MSSPVLEQIEEGQTAPLLAPVAVSAGATSAREQVELAVGHKLVAAGKLQQARLERTLHLAEERGEQFGAVLMNLGLVAQADWAAALAEEMQLPVATASDYSDEAVGLDGLSAGFLRNVSAVPLGLEDGAVMLAVSDPLNPYAANAVGLALEREVRVVVGSSADIESAIGRQYGRSSSADTEVIDALGSADDSAADIEQLKDLAAEAPVIRDVSLLMSRALKQRASDIHIEPFEDALKVRYRIDGVLREVDAPPFKSAAAVISRVKVLANLDIAERRRPQDGRIKLRVEGREIDMRISTLPTLHGESVVMRLLDKGAVALDFDALGFRGRNRALLEAILSRPHGIVLVTGPTGSGKTTTLYAALTELNTADRKVLTVEDPVEYQLAGVNQVQVKPEISVTFAAALRSILRQDPDVIMIGEMRDIETARIAVQAALTGHKVLSTLHTNDAASSVTRLLDMGVEDYLVTSTVNGVLAQRLVRTLCSHCRERYVVEPHVADELGLDKLGRPTEAGRYHAWRAVGCDACERVGYRGRTTIAEILLMDESVRSAILRGADASALRQAAVEQGAGSMYLDGLDKVLDGHTTIEEVERVTREA